MLQAFFFQF